MKYLISKLSGLYEFMLSCGRKSVLLRVDFFSKLYFGFEKKIYLLNLVGYYDTIFIRFLKIILLYFFFKIIFDIIYIFLLVIFECYLVFIEVLFDFLLYLRHFFHIFKKYSKVFIKISDRYYRIVYWFFLLLSFKKVNFKKIVLILKDFSFLKLFEYISDFSLYLLWFFRIRKETRLFYLFIKKMFINFWLLLLGSFLLIILILAQFFYINSLYIFFHNKAKILDYKILPRAETKKKLVFIYFGKILRKVSLFCLDKFIRIILIIFRLVIYLVNNFKERK